MTSRAVTIWQLSFGAIQALGAIVAIIAFFNATTPGWTLLVWSFLGIALAALCVSYFIGSPDRRAYIGLVRTSASREDVLSPPMYDGRIHTLVPLTLWLAVASMVVVFMSNHRTALILVGLAPLWISIVTVGIARLSPHRGSVIALATLCSGLFGAWLGSGGDAATYLGVSWYSLAGYVVVRVLVDRDVTVRIVTATVCSGLFVVSTALVMGRNAIEPLVRPSAFVETGAPFFGLAAYLLVSGRWMAGVWLTDRRAQSSGRTAKRLVE